MEPQDLPYPELTIPLPESIEAEQAVLGTILLEPKESMDEVLAKLQGGEFSKKIHRRIYKCMCELTEEGIPVDVVTLVDRLDEKEWLEAGSVGYISNMANSVPSTANVSHYIEIMKDKYVHRQLILDLREQLSQAYTTSDPAKIMNATQTRMEALSDQATVKKTFKPLRSILPDCFTDLEKIYYAKAEGRISGMTSGFTDLDRMTSGFQKSDLIIVGARPSVGKTAFALNIAGNAAKVTGETIAIFSLEMSEKQLVNRMICAEGNVDASNFRTGHLQEGDWEKVSMAIGSLSENEIFIDDTPAITVTEIRSKCRRLKKENGLGMILIDYLQLISGRGRSENRQQEVSEISRVLKQIARELEVPVIALSQLSRGVESRQDKRPMMSDLRDSGSIEQDADVIAFLYRDDYYERESEKKNIIEIIIAKQRNGPVGTVELAFLKNFNKFTNLDRSYADVIDFDQSTRKTQRVPDMYRK